MQSDVIKRWREKFQAKPWYYRFYIKFRVWKWIQARNIEHYFNWVLSKDYRFRYNNCTFFCDACYEHDWANTDTYCINHKACVVRKAGSYRVKLKKRPVNFEVKL